MTTQAMYDRGLRCKGKGFNCTGCKDKNECVEYIKLKQRFESLQYDLNKLSKSYEDLSENYLYIEKYFTDFLNDLDSSIKFIN